MMRCGKEPVKIGSSMLKRVMCFEASTVFSLLSIYNNSKNNELVTIYKHKKSSLRRPWHITFTSPLGRFGDVV